MYWKRQIIIDNNILLNILNQNEKNSKDDILKKCQSITNNTYCNYIHERGKDKGFICGTISKNKTGRCYTHSRNKNNLYRITKKELKIVKCVLQNHDDKKNKIKIFSSQMSKNENKIIINSEIFLNNIPSIIDICFKNKLIFIFPKHVYNIIIKILFNIDNNFLILQNLNVEKNQQLIINKNKMITNKCSLEKKKKKKKTKIKKVIRINNNINIKDIKNLMEITLYTFDEKVPKDEIACTLHILLKENIKLFKIYVNIILSNMNLFFKNVDIDVLLKIWRNNIEYIPYEKVLIYNNDNNGNIVENVFSYLRNNYDYIPQNVKILWVDFEKNNIVLYSKKYLIDNNKAGIKIYYNNDIKRHNPLPIDKLTILYY